MTSWLAATLHVLDFEGGRRSGILEYGAVTLTGGVVTSTHTRLCAPTGPVEPAEIAVHGIRDLETQNLAPFAADHALFTALRLSGPLAAHHAPVERALLRRTWPVPTAAPDFSAPEPAAAQRVADWGPWIDTRRLYERLHPGQPNYQLMELIRAFALENELQALAATHCPAQRRHPHCALFDALAAALLLINLARQPVASTASLASLIAQSSSPPEESALRQGSFELDE
ncbi:MAG: 3'-5' exonuclease [Opitutales bacterium]